MSFSPISRRSPGAAKREKKTMINERSSLIIVFSVLHYGRYSIETREFPPFDTLIFIPGYHSGWVGGRSWFLGLFRKQPGDDQQDADRQQDDRPIILEIPPQDKGQQGGNEKGEGWELGPVGGQRSRGAARAGRR